MPAQIIAMGGGGFSMEPDNPALDQYILDQTGKARPRVCFLAQASGEAPLYQLNFYRAFNALDARPSMLSLFAPHTADIEGFLMEQDVIYVGGGNTRSMLALWREWELDRILDRACRNGTVLAGISAGANCWFDECTTDSIPGKLTVLSCLGYLKGSCSPHYDGEVKRRPALHGLLAAGEIAPGYGFDNSAAGHFIDGELHQCVASTAAAQVYFINVADGAVRETALPMKRLV